MQVGNKFYCNYINGNWEKQINLFSLWKSKSLGSFMHILISLRICLLNVFSFKVAAYIYSKQKRQHESCWSMRKNKLQLIQSSILPGLLHAKGHSPLFYQCKTALDKMPPLVLYHLVEQNTCWRQLRVCLAESWELLALMANLNEFTTAWGRETVSTSASPAISVLLNGCNRLKKKSIVSVIWPLFLEVFRNISQHHQSCSRPL